MSLLSRLFGGASYAEIEERAAKLDERKFITGVGQRLTNVHEMTADCEEYGCVIHAPSDHCMRDFPTLWRPDRGIMERLCPHGVGHPDPDDQAFITRTRGEGHMEGVHGCDGCCVPGGFEALQSTDEREQEAHKITEQLMRNQS